MALDNFNLSSIFEEKIDGLDFMKGIIGNENNQAGTVEGNKLQTETLNFSSATKEANIPNGTQMTAPNQQASNPPATTPNQPNSPTTTFNTSQNQNLGQNPYEQSMNSGLNVGMQASDSNNQTSSTASSNQPQKYDNPIGPQKVRITDEDKKENNTIPSGGSTGSAGGASSSDNETSNEKKGSMTSNKSQFSNSQKEETKEENKEQKSQGKMSKYGKKIQQDLRTRTQYQYDVEENTRKDSVDSAMKQSGLEEGEYDKYIDVLERTIKSEEQHIQFTKENEVRLLELYGKKDNATGKYTNAKDLLDILNSKDPNKKINFLPLTGKDGEKITNEIWEEIYEEAKYNYKDIEIFQKNSYSELTDNEKVQFVKELEKAKIKEAYKQERKSVYENNNEIDIEGNKGGLGLYKAEDFEKLTEEDKVEFIGRYCSKRYTQLTFTIDDVKEWSDDVDEKFLEGMSDSVADREISVKQLKYMKKEVEMQKEIYKYEKIVYTDDYKNYKEKGTKESFHTTDIHGGQKVELKDRYADKKKYLNSEQNKILDYIYNKQGKEKADEYIHALRGQIAKGKGIEEANEFLKTLESDSDKMNKFMEVMSDKENFDKCLKEGFIDGVGTFGEGISNLFSDDCELSALEWKEQVIMEVLSKNTKFSNGWCDKAYQFGNVVGNLAPSMLASATVTAATGGAAAPAALSTIFESTGQMAGLLTMTLSATGNAKHQALVNGASSMQAWTYGICSGLSEATMERFLGAIPGIGKLEGGYFKKILAEGIEEGSQEFVSAALNSAILGEDIDISDVISQAKESFDMGAAVSAVLNIGSVKTSKIKLKYNGQTVKINENTISKIQEEVNKVNEGEIDPDIGNENVIGILEKEIQKQVGNKNSIDNNNLENIEVKESAKKQKTKESDYEKKLKDINESGDKITAESKDEKSSKNLYNIESKLKKAAQDIKKVNKQEKKEKKEGNLKNVSQKTENQERIRITDDVVSKNSENAKVIPIDEKIEIANNIEENEQMYAAPIFEMFNEQPTDINNNGEIPQYRVSGEFKPYYKLKDLLNSRFQKQIGNVLVVSPTEEGLNFLLNNASEQINQVSNSSHEKILLTDAILSSNDKNNSVGSMVFSDSSRQCREYGGQIIVIDSKKAGLETIRHEFGHLKSAIIKREAYGTIIEKIIEILPQFQIQEKAQRLYDTFDAKLYPILNNFYADFNSRAREIAKKELNYDGIDFNSITQLQLNEINEKLTKKTIEYMKEAGVGAVLDIYDALYGGKINEYFHVGHGAKYYSDINFVCEELIAQYTSLIEGGMLENLRYILPANITETMEMVVSTINSKINANKLVNNAVATGDIKTIIENINYMSENEKAIAVNETVDNLLANNRLEDAYNIATQVNNEFALRKVSQSATKMSEVMLQNGNYDKSMDYAIMSNNDSQLQKVSGAIYTRILDLVNSPNGYNEALNLAEKYFPNSDNNIANLVRGYINLQNGNIFNAMEMLKTLSDGDEKNKLYNKICLKARSDMYNAINVGNLKAAESIANIVGNSNLTTEMIIYKNAINGDSNLAISTAKSYGNQNILSDITYRIKDRAKREYKNRNYELASSLAASINYIRLQQKINKKLSKIGSRMTMVEPKNIDEIANNQQYQQQYQQQWQVPNYQGQVQQVAPIQQNTGPEKDSFVVLSDMHGANWVMDKVKNKYLSQYETIYNLGDIVDRGDNPFNILIDYMELSKQNPEKVVYIPGNHDTFLYGYYRAPNEQVRSMYKRMIELNKLGKTYEATEKLRMQNPQKFEEMLNWLGSQPIQRKVIKGGKKYALAHAFFNETLYRTNPNYSLADYVNQVNPADTNNRIGNILWFRKNKKGHDYYNPADLPSADTTMIIGHTPNADNLDLNGVKIIDVDGSAHKVNPDGTYSARKYTGGNDYEVTVRLDDNSQEVAIANNFMANFQNMYNNQNYAVNRAYTAPTFDIDTINDEIKKELHNVINTDATTNYLNSMNSSNLVIKNLMFDLMDEGYISSLIYDKGNGAFLGKIEETAGSNVRTELEQVEDIYDRITVAQNIQYNDYVEEQINSINLNNVQKQKYNKLLSINNELNKTINLKILDDKYNFLDPILDQLTTSIDLQYRIIHMSDAKLKMLESCYKKLQNDGIYDVPFMSSIILSLQSSPFSNAEAITKCNFYELNSNLEQLIENGYSLTEEEISKLIYLYETGYSYNITNINELRFFDSKDSKYQSAFRNIIELEKKLDNKHIEIIKNMIFLRTYGINYDQAESILERYTIDGIAGYDVLEQYKAIKRIFSENDPDILIKMFEIYDNNTNVNDIGANYYRMASFQEEMKKMYAKEINNAIYKIDKKDYIGKIDGVEMYEVKDNFKMLITSVASYQKGSKIDNYKENWNRKEIMMHRGCFSLIGNDYFSTSMVRNTIFGFSEMNEKMFLDMGNKDMNSADYYAEFRHDSSISTFMSPNELINNSRNGYNELIYERKNLDDNSTIYKKNPDYILYIEEFENIDAEIKTYKDMHEMEAVRYLEMKKQEQDHLYKEAVRAAKEFNIPLVKVNREKFAVSSINRINNLLNEFESTEQPQILSEIITTFETNKFGTLGQIDADSTNNSIIRNKYFSKNKFNSIHERIINKIKSISNETKRQTLINNYKDILKNESRKYIKKRSIPSSIDSTLLDMLKDLK